MNSKILIIIIIGLCIVLFFIYNSKNNKIEIKTEQDMYDELNYAQITDKWIEPKIYDDFLTNDESSYLINHGEKNFKESEILSGTDHSIRKSQTAWIPREDPVAKKIIERVCSIVKLPYENCEDLQVVKYQPGGYYNQHHDSCSDKNEHCLSFIKRGGQRKVTFLIYLSDGFEEGGTKFPVLNKIYKPNKNGGLLFYPLAENTSMCHPKALHVGMPVVSGIKYIANVWIRENKFIK